MAGEQLLIVEDESVIALDIQMMLERWGFTVAGIVALGEEVTSLALETNCRLVLMDIHLAGEMNGIEAAKELLRHYDVPIIFLTAYADESVIQQAITTGSFAYIMKPVDEHELHATIQMALYKTHMDQTLREREAYFRTLIEHSTDIISIIDASGVVQFVSPRVEETLGYRPDELVGNSAFSLVHTEDRENALETWRHSLQNNLSGVTSQFRFRHKNGTWRVMECTGSIPAENSLVDGIIMNARDITDRALMAEALRIERDRAQKYLDIARVMLIALDANGQVTLINPFALQTLGYEANDLLGMDWFDAAVPEEQREQVRQRCMQALADGAGQDIDLEFSVFTRQGDVRFISWHSAALSFEAERATSILLSGEDITERKLAEYNLRYNATHDPLTGLPNRTLFLERLNAVMDRITHDPSRWYAVLFLDLDAFKLVNDSYGHTFGDRLLVATSRRIERCLEPEDMLARLSGDEFFILLDRVTDAMQVIEAAKKILAELSTPLLLDGKSLQVTCSIGIVLCNRPNLFVDDIVRDADIAMYQAKEKGKNGFAFFMPAMRTQPIARLQLENDLRRALEQREFSLYYQPILAMDGFRLVGVEALLRWNRGDKGLILPGEFISVLEETGLILPVGEWILNEACRKIRRWTDTYQLDPWFSVSVNVSARQFTHPAFVDQVRHALHANGVDPTQLILELTESVLLGNAETARSVMQRLNDLGVLIQIDDFGTGYSSYSSLHTLPFDAIKIDRTFVQQLDQGDRRVEFVRSIVRLAESIGAETIAEGVETPEQIERIQALGCKQAQGFYISRPLGPTALESWLVHFAARRDPAPGDVGVAPRPPGTSPLRKAQTGFFKRLP